MRLALLVLAVIVPLRKARAELPEPVDPASVTDGASFALTGGLL